MCVSLQLHLLLYVFLLVLIYAIQFCRRKKLKAKRDKRESAARREDARRTSESDVDPSASASATSTSDLSASASTSGASLEAAGGGRDPGPGREAPDKEGRDLRMAMSKAGKPEDELWLHRALIVSHILRCLVFKEKNGMVALVNAVSDAHQVLNASTAHQRLIIITGIPTTLQPDFVKQALRSIFQSNGGIDRDEIFLPYSESVPIVKPVATKDETSSEASATAVSSQQNTGVQESENQTAGAQSEAGKADTAVLEVKKETKLHGYAVLSVMSRTKLENVKKSLMKSQALFEGSSVDHDDVIDMPSIVTVGANLLTQEEHANVPLENYLKYKFFQDKDETEIGDAATLALTEIFTSCFIVEQRHGSPEFRQESGYICLTKEQIVQHTPENLLCAFFGNIRPPKKSTMEQVAQVLKRYGIVVTPDKEGWVQNFFTYHVLKQMKTYS